MQLKERETVGHDEQDGGGERKGEPAGRRLAVERRQEMIAAWTRRALARPERIDFDHQIAFGTRHVEASIHEEIVVQKNAAIRASAEEAPPASSSISRTPPTPRGHVR